MQEQLIKSNMSHIEPYLNTLFGPSNKLWQVAAVAQCLAICSNAHVIVQAEEIIAGHLQQDASHMWCSDQCAKLQCTKSKDLIKAAGSRLLDQGCCTRPQNMCCIAKICKLHTVSSLACCIRFVGHVHMSEYTKLSCSICLYWGAVCNMPTKWQPEH